MSDDKKSESRADAHAVPGDVWKYIEEREENLSNYSDKLRENVMKIFAQFGSDVDVCMKCGWREGTSTHFHYFRRYSAQSYSSGPRYVNEVPSDGEIIDKDQDVGHHSNTETGKYYYEKLDFDHKYVPPRKLSISINVFDDEAFFVDNRGDYKLVLKNGHLFIRLDEIDEYGEESRYKYFSGIATGDYETLCDAPSRLVLKELIKSGRLITFIKKIEEELKDTGEEYKEVADLAEAIATAI